MKKIKLSLEKLEPVIARIEKLSTVQRVLIYALTFLTVVGLVVWFGLMPKYQRIEELNTELGDLEGKLVVAKRNAAQLPKLREKMQEAEDRYKLVMKALPEKQEIPSLLTSVSQSGKEAGLQFLLFQPAGEVSKDFYAEISVAINIVGGFHQVAEFFDRVASLNRIVNIKNINMKPVAEGKMELNTSCTAVTYKFVEKTQSEDKNKKKRQK
ncbi:MAG: type 4a pilus biogenesis protein PilO [Pseudomonadota bacterium]